MPSRRLNRRQVRRRPVSKTRPALAHAGFHRGAISQEDCRGGTPAPPVSYVDESNMLHACLNNITGAFRTVRASANCGYGEANVK